MNLFGKFGGYRTLDSFNLASVIQLATWRFCNTFLIRRTPKNSPHTGQPFWGCTGYPAGNHGETIYA